LPFLVINIIIVRRATRDAPRVPKVFPRCNSLFSLPALANSNFKLLPSPPVFVVINCLEEAFGIMAVFIVLQRAASPLPGTFYQPLNLRPAYSFNSSSLKSMLEMIQQYQNVAKALLRAARYYSGRAAGATSTPGTKRAVYSPYS